MQRIPKLTQSRKYSFWSFIVLMNLLALLIRLPFLHYQNYDLVKFVLPWLDFIRTHGHFSALSESFANYTPAYLYLLTVVSFLPSQLNILAIKVLSIAFDWAAAVVVYKIVRLKHPHSTTPWLAYLLVLFLPTVLINSAYWGQCDIIYTFFLLLAVYYLLQMKTLQGVVSFGFAFAFKAQAVFLAPLLLLFIIRRKMPVSYLLIPAGVYFATIIPAWLLGSPLVNLLSIYFSQGQTYQQLTMNAPNLYLFLRSMDYSLGVIFGLLLSAFAVCVYLWIGYKRRLTDHPTGIALAAALSAVLLPFVLPKMHERYFFPGCIMALVLAFYLPRLRLLPMGLQVASMIAYVPFLRGYEVIPLEAAGLLTTGIIVWLWVEYSACPLPGLPHAAEKANVETV